jgi:predicted O-methyltransferase YrrM
MIRSPEKFPMQAERSPKNLAERIIAQAKRPRYSLAVIVAVLGLNTVALVSALGVVAWRYRHQRNEVRRQLNQLAAAAYRSPLPKVMVAVGRPAPDQQPYRREYDFTQDWFTGNVPVWEEVLAPYKGRRGIRYLEIGLYEGRSAVWMLENVLTHPTAHLTGVDVFEGSLKDRYLDNIRRSGYADKVTTIVEPSQVALRRLPLESFDVIYIDGSHAVSDVLEDAVLSYRLLKPGGILIFDDYQWAGCLYQGPGTHDSPADFPKAAIDRFFQCFDRNFDVIHNSKQLILRKSSALQ